MSTFLLHNYLLGCTYEDKFHFFWIFFIQYFFSFFWYLEMVEYGGSYNGYKDSNICKIMKNQLYFRRNNSLLIGSDSKHFGNRRVILWQNPNHYSSNRIFRIILVGIYLNMMKKRYFLCLLFGFVTYLFILFFFEKCIKKIQLTYKKIDKNSIN